MKTFKGANKITVKTDVNSSYDILLRDSFTELADALHKTSCDGHRICIITDTNVSPIYLAAVTEQLSMCSTKLITIELPSGEANKKLSFIRQIYEQLILAGFDRSDYLLALGGGVVGDMTGFAAATYMRGIRFIQVPTTLLSQIDSSIGGKTGVDFDSYKNMVGAFHQPSLVYINISVLNTLPEEQFASGMGELLKYGISLDADFYEWTLDHMSEIDERDPETLCAMITRCCQLKQYIVEKDPKEKGDRALLNFGHTLGHAIEKLKGFSMLHGECVALGFVAAAYISWKRGMISEEEFFEIRDMNVGFGLPISFEHLSAEDIVKAAKHDKKMEAGTIKFVLLKKLGKAYVDCTVTDSEMIEALNFLRADYEA